MTNVSSSSEHHIKRERKKNLTSTTVHSAPIPAVPECHRNTHKCKSINLINTNCFGITKNVISKTITAFEHISFNISIVMNNKTFVY